MAKKEAVSAAVISDITKKDMDASGNMASAFHIASKPESIPTMFMNQVEPSVPKADVAPVASKPVAASSLSLPIHIQSSFTDFFSDNYNRIKVPLTWQRIISGAVLMVVGLVLSLYGFRYLRFSLLLTGFVGGAIAAFAILTNTEPTPEWSHRILIYVAVCVAAGLLVGLIMLGLNKYASWILGGAGGLALGVYILSWREGGLIHNTAGRIGLMAGSAALGMFLSTFLGSLTVIFCTVLVGGYMFTLGLDMFLRTGFLENYKNLFRTGSKVPYQLYGGIYGMLGVLSLMFLLGYLFQIPLYFMHKRKTRAHAVPPVNGPYGYGNGSQYGGQYGSRDNLAPGQPRPTPNEYTWWGKRKNAPVHDNHGPYGNYNEKGYQHLPNQSQSSNNLLNQSQPQYHQHSYQQQPHNVVTSTPQQTHITSVASTTTNGDKAVVFEEKKSWLGHTKVVPKLVDSNTVASTGAGSTGTVHGTSSTTTTTHNNTNNTSSHVASGSNHVHA
ncbi:hypothetical protein BGZ94_005820 [Podila epigama]|nr:hypothetical protein BGZ94_005820 [Podila epigama]